MDERPTTTGFTSTIERGKLNSLESPTIRNSKYEIRTSNESRYHQSVLDTRKNDSIIEKPNIKTDRIRMNTQGGDRLVAKRRIAQHEKHFDQNLRPVKIERGRFNTFKHLEQAKNKFDPQSS